MTTISFDHLGLHESLLANIRAKGWTEPTPVQAEAIPLLFEGVDVVAQARTGTGKTAAFGLPIIQKTRGPGLNTLILAPTRELANQIRDELNELGRGACGGSFGALAVYGGVGYGPQMKALRRDGATCLVACPGRLLDLIQRRAVDLSGIKHVILDEADRMLDMGFIHDINRIFEHLPAKGKRQTSLFSATVPKRVMGLVNQYLEQSGWVKSEKGPLSTPLAEQFHVRVGQDRLAALLTLLDQERPERAVVFTRTKHTAKRFAQKLEKAGYMATDLQGNLSQRKRDAAMEAFRRGAVKILVATDVAARGIDVSELTHVIQIDVPTVAEDYVHRTGRTGRAGREGRAFLFVAPGDEYAFRTIERVAGVPIREFNLGPLLRVSRDVAEAGPKARRYEHEGGLRTGGRDGPRSGRAPGTGTTGASDQDRAPHGASRRHPKPARSHGGGGGRGPGGASGHVATCATCGNEARVPFVPTQGRPVYCKACFKPKARPAHARGPGAGRR